MNIRSNRFIVAISLVVLAACTNQVTPPPAPTPGGVLSSGVLVTFSTHGESFNIWLTKSDLIEELEELRRPDRIQLSPEGQVQPGPGVGNHNAPWGWYFNEEDLEFVTSVDPNCNMPPSEVESNLTRFMEHIGRYCPGAELLLTTQYP